MDRKLNRKVNLLIGYAVVSTVLFAFILFSAFRRHEQKLSLDELTLKRLNVVGEDGSLRVVISNETRQHSGRAEGKDQAARKRGAGFLFFNEDGDECGGLLYELNHQHDTAHSYMGFTMDQYRNDQVIQIINEENYQGDQAQIFRGYRINEYPKGSRLAANLDRMNEIKKIKNPEERQRQMAELRKTAIERTRVFLGMAPDSLDGLFLFDHQGKPRMKIYVDPEGNPRFEVIHRDGTVKDVLGALEK